MPIPVRCGCGNQFQATDALAGRAVNCPNCGQLLSVPAAAAWGGMAGFPQPPGYPAGAMPLGGPFAPPMGGYGTFAPAVGSGPTATPAPKRKKAKKSGDDDQAARIAGTAVAGVIILVLLVVLVWIGLAVVGWVRYTNAKGRLNAALSSEAEGGSADSAAYAVAADYGYLVRYCEDHYAANDNRSQELLGVLGRVIPHLPESADLETLMHLPAGCSPYSASVAVVARRADHGWLIERSCDGEEGVRQFAARSLKLSFPFGRLDDSGLAELAVATSVEEKESKFQQLYDTAHKAIEAQLVGQYRLHLNAVWKTDSGGETPYELTTAENVAEVACANRDWTIKLGDQVWTGKVDDLPRARLECPLAKLPAELARFQGLGPDVVAHLGCSGSEFSVLLLPVPNYVPSRRVDVNEGDDIPFGAEVTSVYDSGVLVQHYYFEPGSDGFSWFAAQLVK